MITDPELDQWSELFRSAQAEPAELVARAKAAIRRFRFWIYAEIAVTVVTGGGMTFWAARTHQRSVTVLAVWVWISLAAAWLFRLINDWNDFTGVAVATGSYLNILLRRLRSNRRAAEFGAVLYFVQLAVTSSWVFRELNVSLREFVLLPTNILFATGTIVFCVWLVLYRRKLQTQIAELQKLKTDSEEQLPRKAEAITALFAHAIGNFQQRLKKILRAY